MVQIVEVVVLLPLSWRFLIVVCRGQKVENPVAILQDLLPPLPLYVGATNVNKLNPHFLRLLQVVPLLRLFLVHEEVPDDVLTHPRGGFSAQEDVLLARNVAGLEYPPDALEV